MVIACENFMVKLCCVNLCKPSTVMVIFCMCECVLCTGVIVYSLSLSPSPFLSPSPTPHLHAQYLVLYVLIIKKIVKI